MSQVQYDFSFGTLVYLLKKHWCPKCVTQKLKVSFTVIEVSSNPSELKMGRYYFCGDKTIKTPCLYCEKCHSRFSVEDIKAFEKRDMG